MLKYSDLTPWEKNKICNGCGAKGGWIKVPNFLFKASCNQHDFYYWRGCYEEDRFKADNAFYKFMRKDIQRASWSLKPYYHFWAFTYYVAVRMFGSKYFNYSYRYKNLEDIK